jgi:hypothetical protein
VVRGVVLNDNGTAASVSSGHCGFKER